MTFVQASPLSVLDSIGVNVVNLLKRDGRYCWLRIVIAELVRSTHPRCGIYVTLGTGMTSATVRVHFTDAVPCQDAAWIRLNLLSIGHLTPDAIVKETRGVKPPLQGKKIIPLGVLLLS